MFKEIIYSINRVCDRIAQGILVAMMVFICVDILMMHTWKGIVGTPSVVSVMGLVLISLAMGHCGVSKGHVAVDLLSGRFRQRTKAIIGSFTGCISVSVFALAAFQCLVYGAQLQHNGVVVPVINISAFPFAYLIGFGCIMLSLVILVDVIEALREAVRR